MFYYVHNYLQGVLDANVSQGWTLIGISLFREQVQVLKLPILMKWRRVWVVKVKVLCLQLLSRLANNNQSKSQTTENSFNG